MIVEITIPDISIQIGDPVLREAEHKDEYPGPYDISPTSETQTLQTEGKTMTRDVKVAPAPVSSVNGQTGAVQLDADDVGALPNTTVVPNKTSQLTNDSGFVDETGAASAAPVQSVNGQTGDITLGAEDVGALPDSTPIPSSASDVGALPDNTTYAASPSVGGPATKTNAIHYGAVDGTSTATAFTAQIDGITSYYDGLCVMLKNGVVTSAAGFTIDINGLGAKPSYNNMAAATADTTIFNANYTMLFVYDSTRVSGGCWICYRGYNSDNNTIGYQLRTNSYSLPMAEKVYRYRLLFTSADGTKFVGANKSTSTNATASRTTNTTPIDPFGAIVYYGSTTAVNAGDTPGTSVLWQQYNITLGYSFNTSGAALTLTQRKPVYLRCNPQSDGSAVMEYFTQELPNSEDGKIYIFLGVATGATTVELNVRHPVYYYKAGAIRAWVNPAPGSGGGSGGSDLTYLGQTPYKLTQNEAAIQLSAVGSCSYDVSSDTVAEFDPLTGTTNLATVTKDGSVYKLAAGNASNWYQSYLDMTVTGLTVGATYNFVFDAQGVEEDYNAHKTIGHYILYDANDNTLATRGATDGAHLNSYSFTATTTSVKLRWYPSNNTYYSANASVASANRMYINKDGTTAYTGVVSMSGTFTDDTVLRGIPAGATITSSPTCSVYSKDVGSETLPLKGKVVVCFGDSLFGMYRGDTSAPAFVAEVTGATVYNVGFGGCRMSTHPSTGYAAFSMWALADAVASGDWSMQEAQKNSGSDYFPEQLALLESIDFSTVDYVVIHYGTNDFGGGVAIGENSLSTDHSTLCGALKYSIEALLGAYPKLRIFISLPVYRYWVSGNTTTYAEDYTNSQNDKLPDAVAAMQRVTAAYNIPVIDGYHLLGINKINASTFLSDGTHHNEDGRRRFGHFIGAQLISNI